MSDSQSPTSVKILWSEDNRCLRDQILEKLGLDDTKWDYVLLPRFQDELYLGNDNV
jgi:hypothetical protein